MDILYGYIFGILYGVLCIALGLIAYKIGMPKKYSRKLVHILVGFEWVILNHFMGASPHFLIVCILFSALLLISYFKKLMPMISSDSDNAPGTVYYGLAMTFMASISLFVPKMIIPFGIGVFATSIGDGFAGVLGQLFNKRNPKIFGSKTLLGTLSSFAFSALSAFVINEVYGAGLTLFECAFIGALSSGLELITVFGLDNIIITLGVSFFSYALIYMPIINIFIVPILATPFVIAVVAEKKVLTKSALLLAIFLDCIVSLALGNFGFVLLLSFLLLSVVADKVKDIKKRSEGVDKKSGMRDAVQVIANGLVPMIMAIIYVVTADKIFIIAYIAALAEALADTVASGLGVFSKSTFDLFRFKKTDAGLSGGMSVIGTVSSLLASFIISGIALAFGAVDIKLMLLISASAFLGAVFDSLLGSVVQIKYRCAVCGKITEKEYHCKKKANRYSGFEFFDNDVVNLLSSLFAAALAAIFALTLG